MKRQTIGCLGALLGGWTLMIDVQSAFSGIDGVMFTPMSLARIVSDLLFLYLSGSLLRKPND
jgi:hypothetical protein